MNQAEMLMYAAQLARWLNEELGRQEIDTRRKEKYRSVEGPWRVGKTEKDRRSGAFMRNENNKAARRDWKRGEPWPFHTCNGKRNRHRWTGKGKKTVILGRKEKYAS